MTMKQLAHLAQQSLQARARCIVKRSHVHELLAAALGFGSWAALIAEALPVDAGVSDLPSDVLPRLTARAIQLGYGQGAAEAIGRVLQELCVEQQLSTVRWSELMALMEPVAWPAISDEELEDDEGDWNDDPASEIDTRAPMRDRLLRSPLLLDGLGRWADGGGAERHRILANLLHCKRPDPYLYEESLKGRVLNAAFHLVFELQYAKALAGMTGGLLMLGDADYDEQRDVASILDDIPDDDRAWWSDERVAKLKRQVSDRHLAMIRKRLHADARVVATAFRRMRKGRSMAELRFDGLAGCLRTPKGGSAKQIVVIIPSFGERYLSTILYSDLMD